MNGKVWKVVAPVCALAAIWAGHPGSVKDGYTYETSCHDNLDRSNVTYK